MSRVPIGTRAPAPVTDVQGAQSVGGVRADAPASASRTIHTGDGIAWIDTNPLSASHAVVTSLPDISETRSRSVPRWREWFVNTAELLCASSVFE